MTAFEDDPQIVIVLNGKAIQIIILTDLEYHPTLMQIFWNVKE
jgi:hypothetical protein